MNLDSISSLRLNESIDPNAVVRESFMVLH